MSNVAIKKTTTLALGMAMAASMAAPVHADVNPFGMSALSSGYMVAEAKSTEGKCGEAKCGADKATVKPIQEAKCGEAKCGADKATAKPIQEAKCGEAKCGSNK